MVQHQAEEVVVDMSVASGQPKVIRIREIYFVRIITLSSIQKSYCNWHIQYSTVQYSTVQYSTVQYSTVQYSTVQYKASPLCNMHALITANKIVSSNIKFSSFIYCTLKFPLHVL
jgi:hypothetical protein